MSDDPREVHIIGPIYVRRRAPDDPTRLAFKEFADALLAFRAAVLDTWPFRLADRCVARLNRAHRRV